MDELLKPKKIDYNVKGCCEALKSIDKLISRLQAEIRNYTEEEFKLSGLTRDKNGEVQFPRSFDIDKCLRTEAKICYKYWEKTGKVPQGHGILKILVYYGEKCQKDKNKSAHCLYNLAKFYLMHDMLLKYPEEKTYLRFKGMLEKIDCRYAKRKLKYLNKIEAVHKKILRNNEEWKGVELFKRVLNGSIFINHLGVPDPDPDDYDYSYSSSSYSSSDSSYDSGDSDYAYESTSNRRSFVDHLGRETYHTDDYGHRLYDDREHHVGYISGNRIYDENHDQVGFIDDSGRCHKL